MCARTSRLRLIVIPLLVTLLAVPSVGTGSVQASPMRITQVTVKDFGSRLVVGIVATGRILFNVTEISTPLPPRVAVDVLNAVADDRVRTATEVKKGNVLRVRVGQFQDSPAIARIVVDFVRSVPVDVQLTAPNILSLSVPLGPVTEAGAVAAGGLPSPTRTGSMASAVSAAPGTGVIKTAQQPALPGVPTGPGLIKLLEFRAVALSDVLSALAKLCGFNLVTDSAPQGAITLRLLDVTCEEALRFVLEANNLAFRRLGKNIIVGAADKLAPPPEVPETISYRLAYGDPNQVRAAIAAAVPGVRVAIDPRTNALLITGTSAQHEEVVKVLASLDIRIPQVVIQVHAIEVSNTALTDLGLFGGEGSSVPPAQPGAQEFGRVVVDSANNRLSFTLVNASLFFFRLRALVNEGKARVITAPRVATLDGNTASILLGQRVPIFTSVTVGGQLQTTVSYVDVGVKLETTPRVNTDQLITLTLKPDVSTLGAPISSGGQTAYILNTRSANTTLSVADGKTIVLGGLISRDERETVVKVPLLGDIPIVGELFRTTETSRTETELIFLITPQIVKD